MHVRHLSLTNFRNYVRLETDLPPGVAVFEGANAQGKTNLLESIYFLATTRFSRTVAERELINWEAVKETMPYARLSGEVLREEGTIKLDIVLRPRPTGEREGGVSAALMQKSIRVNGIARRAVDLVGQLNVVMFSPRDIDLIGGEPSLRRRYLDITNCQVDPRYTTALQRYNRVLLRRNHLLRRLAAREAGQDELAFWDQELISTGSYIMMRRELTMAALNALADPINRQLSGGGEDLQLIYRRSVQGSTPELAGLDEVKLAFSRSLAEALDRELARGVSLVGPHRDDVSFRVSGVDMGPYGSRGQQRTAVLSLKLAELQFMLAETGQRPVLLLDDVLSELDAGRRRHLLEAVSDHHQVLITTSDIDRFPEEFLARSDRFTVQDGKIFL